MNDPFPSGTMQSARGLFLFELSVIYNAEQVFVSMLQGAVDRAQRPALKDAIRRHEVETRDQQQTLQRVFQTLGAQPLSVVCHAAEGLAQSLQDAIAAQPSRSVIDSLLASAVSKTEYFEIASYNGLVQMARSMGQREIADMLQQILEQENAMRQTVDTLILELAQETGQSIGTEYIGNLTEASLDAARAAE